MQHFIIQDNSTINLQIVQTYIYIYSLSQLKFIFFLDENLEVNLKDF